MARDIDSDMTDSSSGIEFLLNRYKETSKKMELNRLMDENKIVRFAQALKGIEGQKFIFFIYQREFRPEIQTMTLNTLMNQYSENPNITSDLHDLFQGYSRDFTVNIDLVNKTFANSSVQFNLIYIHKTPENISGITLREQSEDVFKAYSQVAQATGGTVDSSQNPAAGFQNAMTKADSYYLLYYSPLGYKKDGQFKAITVKVKNPAHSIHHRLGYFAN